MVNVQIIGYNILFILIQYFLSGKCKMHPKIVGGGLADISDFPYVAYLAIFPEKDNNTFACGSSILVKNLLLTAGHCIETCAKHSQIVVSAGHATSMMGALSTASAYVIHELYGESEASNDIALIKLKTPFEYSANIGPVGLYSSATLYEKEAKVAGWGLTSTGQTSQQLKCVDQYVIDIKKCIEILQSLNKNEICATSEVGHPSRGDSGSPLVIQGHVQIGIVSYSNPMLSKDLVVYTEVAKHSTWIKKQWHRLKKEKN